MNLDFVDPGAAGHSTEPVERVQTCAACGAELDRVRGTIAVEVRCPRCRSGGEVHLSPSGQPTHAVGPAVSDPVATDGGVETADPGTIADRVAFDVDELGYDRETAIRNRLGDQDVEPEALREYVGNESWLEEPIAEASLVDRLRELGLSSIEVYWFLDEEPAVRSIFQAIGDQEEVAAGEIVERTGYHERTVYNALGRLRREYRVVRSWKDPADARRRFYTLADAESPDRLSEEGISHDN